MSVRLSSLITLVRGIIVDRAETGITNAFTDAEITAAINHTKDGFFGMRPEAFCISSILTSPPDDAPAPPETLTISCLDDPAFSGEYTKSGLRWEMGTTHALWKDTLWYLSDGTTAYSAADNGSETPPATFTRTLEYPTTITVSGATIEISVDGVYNYNGLLNGKPSYILGTETIYFDTDKWIIDSPDTDPETGHYFSILSSSYLPPTSGFNTDDVYAVGVLPAPTLEYSLEGTASITLFETGDTSATPAEWIADAEIAINPWAVLQFCYGVSAFLLMQRSKDAFYRKAADALIKLYNQG